MSTKSNENGVFMKWLLLSALTFILPAYSIPTGIDLGAEKMSQNEEKEEDLFKKNDQIYAGHLEFLYWTVTEGNLDYALKMRGPAWSETTPSYAQGKFESASYGMAPGFRLGLHYFRATRYWELRWNYTRLTCTGKDEAFRPEPSNEYLTGTWPQVFTNPMTHAQSKLHFNYNVFDMLVDRVFIPNPHLRLRIIAGGTAAWMDQDWNVKYFDGNGNSTKISNRWNYAGGGIKSGTMVDWFWTRDIYITGSTMFGALLGNYSNHAKQLTNYGPNVGDNTAVPIRNTSYHDVRPTFTTQMIIGPSWQKNLPKNRIELFAGFEMNLWFNLQEVYRSTSSTAMGAKETWINSSTLALYGLTTRLTVDF